MQSFSFFVLYHFCDLWNCFYYFILFAGSGGWSKHKEGGICHAHALISVKSQEFFHISYPALSPSSRLPHRFFVRSTRNSYSILSVGQGCCKLFNGLNGVSEGGGKGKRVARVSCMLHGVCTIFLTSSQIWFLLFVVEFEMIMETFPMFFTSSVPHASPPSLPLCCRPGYNLHYALCWSTRIFGYGKFSGLVPLLLPLIWIMQQQQQR